VTIENVKLGISIDLPDVNQRIVEDFFKAIRDFQGGELVLSGPENAGAVVRAAAVVGLLGDMDEDDVDEMHPANVLVIAQGINNHVAEALEIPGE
jgi:hypothetical protein